MATRFVRSTLRALAVCGLLLGSGLLVTPAQGQLPGEDCNVFPGTSIQSAIDNAPAGARIVVCAGIYPEKLTIRKDGLILEGRPGAVLDGSVLAGTRHGITINDGVQGFTINGFEIREFDDPLSNSDPSTAIMAQGAATGVRIENNYIHDNAWAGITFGRNSRGWTIAGNWFEQNGFAHVVSHDAKDFTIEANDLGSATVAVFMAQAQKASVGRNLFSGEGSAALVVAPALDLSGWSFLVTIHNNTVEGNWTHGIWGVALQRSIIRDNHVSVAGTEITLGGDPEQLALHNNDASLVVETKEIRETLIQFEEATGGSEPQSFSVQAKRCHWYSCWIASTWNGLQRLANVLLPSASAQVPPTLPPPCELLFSSPCPGAMEALVESILFTAMNPGATPASEGTHAKLEACRGLPDDCLRAQFFNPADTLPPHTWSIAIENDPLLGNVELRFIDVGVRRDEDMLARRLVSDALNQNWTTIILCRLYAEGVSTSCASVPRLFDFGLDLTWTQSEFARHVSAWRLKLPTNLTHASFDRVHGTDATLFYAMSKPHHAESPPPPAAITGEQDVVLGDPLRAEYSGSAVLQCEILAISINPNGQPTLSHDCPATTLLKSPTLRSYYWCSSILPDLVGQARTDESIHETRAQEIAAGYWSWSPYCSDLEDPFVANWTTVYNQTDLSALGGAQSEYYGATSDFARDEAARRAEAILLNVIARHLALKLEGIGLPQDVDLTALNSSAGFNVTALEWESGIRANLRLTKIEVFDQAAGWVQVGTSGLVAFTPVRLSLQSQFRGLNGDLLDDQLVFTLNGEHANVTNASIIVNYGGVRYGNLVLWDKDNRDYASDFSAGTTKSHTFPFASIYAGEQTGPVGPALGKGLFDVGFTVPAGVGNITACIQEIWTARSDGTAENFAGLTRATVETLATDTEKKCPVFDLLNEINLQLFANLLVTLVLRERECVVSDLLPPGDPNRCDVVYQLIGEPLIQLVNHTQLTQPHTLVEALERYVPNVASTARLGQVRLVIDVPPMPPFAKAQLIVDLVRELMQSIGLLVILLDDVPLTKPLRKWLDYAIYGHGLVVLAGAGVLPDNARPWKVQDKLMTIKGLPSHPGVITIGAGSKMLGVAPWSRLGPTAALTPKPDFVAPSPPGSTTGAVLNALPYIEAVMLRGLHHVDLVRPTLASFSVPVKSQNGGPATYWEQGLGALDLAAFVQLPPDTRGLIDIIGEFTNRTRAIVENQTASLLNLSVQEVVDSAPGEVLGAVAWLSDALIRLAFSETLLNLTIDSPAFPSTLAADFGVVNREREGAAGLMAVDLDSILNHTVASYRELLRSAGYASESQIDPIIQRMLWLFNVTAKEGQEVTLNATHYYFFDTLRGDLLYTIQNRLLDAAVRDTGSLPPGANATNLAKVRSDLAPWLLTPRYLTGQKTGTTKLPVDVDAECPDQIPAEGVLRMADAVLQILRAEAQMMVPTLKHPLVDELWPSLDVDPLMLLPLRALRDQAGQLLCLQDVIELLQYLKARAEELREIKMVPWAAWNGTEAWAGTWDRTALGGQVKGALESAGVDPGDAAGENSAAVLDATIDLLGRAIDIVAQRLALLRVPNIWSDVPEGPRDLVTLPARTKTNPLGLYVGFATVTSHNVEIRNPFTNQTVLTRNITIPIPSVLWNNPTLIVDVAFRDTTPIANTTALMWHAKPNIFSSISRENNPTFPQNQSNIPLVVNWTKLLKEEKRAVWLRLNVTVEAKVQVNATALIPPSLKSMAVEQLANLSGELRKRLEELNVSIEAMLPGDTPMTGVPIAPAMSTLVSRLNHQQGTTNETGRTVLWNLFPGSYRFFEPYSYAAAADLNHDYPMVNPGAGGLEGPMEDLDRELQAYTRSVQMGLAPHPTAATAAAPDPWAFDQASSPTWWKLSTEAKRTRATTRDLDYALQVDAAVDDSLATSQYVNRSVVQGDVVLEGFVRIDSGPSPPAVPVAFQVTWFSSTGSEITSSFPLPEIAQRTQWVQFSSTLSTSLGGGEYATLMKTFSIISTSAARYFVDGLSVTNRDAQGVPQKSMLLNPSFEDPWACGNLTPSCDYMPFFEVNGQRYGPFHQFSAVLKGADLMGLACLQAWNFAIGTDTPVGYPGCRAPLLSTEGELAIGVVVQVMDCMVGSGETGLGSDLDAACEAFREGAEEAQKQCNEIKPESCLPKNEYERFLEVLINLSAELSFSAVLPANGMLVPFFHSPTRMAIQSPANATFTVNDLLPAARRYNPGVPDLQLKKDINSVLKNLTTLMGPQSTGIVVTDPPLTSTFKTTQPQGILHRLTDKVSGLDWSNFGVSVPQTVSGEEARDQLSVAGQMIKNLTDNRTVFLLRERMFAPEAAEAFNAGLATPLADKATMIMEGWRPNGTITPEGLRLPDKTKSSKLIGNDECRERLAISSALPAGYFACAGISALEGGPELKGVGNVDKVQFANAVVEQIKQYPDYATNASARSAILENATAMSTTPTGQGWNRTNDGIRLNSTGGSGLGLMAYSIPLPVNEFVQMRMDGEILLDKTGLIMITTTDASIPASLLDLVGKLSADSDRLDRLDESISPQNLTKVCSTITPQPRLCHPLLGTAYNSTLGTLYAIDKALRKATQSYAHDLRVEALGLPIGFEEVITSDPEGKDNGGVSHSCLLCAHGLAIARTDRLYNYSRQNEFATKVRLRDGESDLGAKEFFVVMLYVPLGAPQKFMLKNFTIQITTYIGFGGDGNLANPNDDDRVTHEFGMEVPIRYHPRIEDWKMLYAVPDQALGDGLTVRFGMKDAPAAEFIPQPTDLVRGLGMPSLDSKCHDTNAPGFPVHSYYRDPRGIPAMLGKEWSTLYWAGVGNCAQNGIRALQPKHFEGAGGRYASVKPEEKKVSDALGYVSNVDADGDKYRPERFQRWINVPLGAGCSVACDPLQILYSAKASEETALPTGPLVSAAVSAAESGIAAATGIVGSLLAVPNPALHMNVTPFLHSGFLVANQSGYRSDPSVGPPVHNFVLFTASDARLLMGNDPNPERIIVLSDVSSESKAALVENPAVMNFSGQRLVPRGDVSYRGLVAAHRLDITRGIPFLEATEPDSPQQQLRQNVTEIGQILVGHGLSGVGLALHVRSEQVVVLNDHDRMRALQGLEATADAQVRIEAFSLGGNITVGSDCNRVPLYDYVRPYFRCTGYDRHMLKANVGAGAAPTQCYTPALQFLAELQNEGTERLLRLPFVPYYLPGPFGDELEDALTISDAEPTDSGNETVTRTAILLGEAMDTVTNATLRAKDLLDCLATSGGAGWFEDKEISRAALGAATAALNETMDENLVAASQKMQEIVQVLQPWLYEHGEPTRFVAAKILLPDEILADQAVPLAGVFPVPYAVEEWSSHVSHGALNLTVTDRSGISTASTLASITGPVVSSVTLNLRHGHTYELNLTVVDEHGNRFRDLATFTSDAFAPNVTVNPLSLSPFSNAISVSFTARDDATGIAQARLELDSGNGWQTVKTRSAPADQDLTLTWSNTTAGLAGFDTKKLRLRLLVEDGAHHRNATQRHDFQVSSEGFGVITDRPSTTIGWNAAGRIDYSVDPAISSAEVYGRGLRKTLTHSTSFQIQSDWHVTKCGATNTATYPLVLDAPGTPSKIYVWGKGNCPQDALIRYVSKSGFGGTIVKTVFFGVQEGKEYRIGITYDAATKQFGFRVIRLTDGAIVASDSYTIANPSQHGFTFSRVRVMGGNNGPAGSTGTCMGCAFATGWVDNIQVDTIPELSTTVDTTLPTLPSLSTLFTEKLNLAGVGWIVDKGYLNATTTAQDSNSGLASLNVTLKNVTTSNTETWYASGNLNGATSHTTALSKVAPPLDKTFEFTATARDRAGNQRTFTSESVEIRVRPSVKLIVPSLALQDVGYLRIAGEAAVPGYSSASVDSLRVRVVAPNGTAIVNVTSTGSAGTTTLQTTWTVGTPAPGLYDVILDSTRHGVSEQITSRANFVKAWRGGTNLTGLRYDHLATTADVDAYRFAVPACHTGFRITAFSHDNKSLQLYSMRLADFSSEIVIDGVGWSDGDSGTTAVYEVHSAVPGDAYAVKVKSGASNNFYQVKFEKLDKVCDLN